MARIKADRGGLIEDFLRRQKIARRGAGRKGIGNAIAHAKPKARLPVAGGPDGPITFTDPAPGSVGRKPGFDVQNPIVRKPVGSKPPQVPGAQRIDRVIGGYGDTSPQAQTQWTPQYKQFFESHGGAQGFQQREAQRQDKRYAASIGPGPYDKRVSVRKNARKRRTIGGGTVY